MMPCKNSIIAGDHGGPIKTVLVSIHLIDSITVPDEMKRRSVFTEIFIDNVPLMTF